MTSKGINVGAAASPGEDGGTFFHLIIIIYIL